MFVFDTDHLTIYLRDQEPEVLSIAERMVLYRENQFFATIVSFHEQMLAWHAYLNRARDSKGVIKGYAMFADVIQDYAAMQVLPFDEAAATQYESLKEQRVRIGTMDLRIAAIALSRGYRILTRNTVHFEKVPGLLIEDWTK